ncbi:DUF6192 family protein [Streptomyces sp. NPDC007088]
MDAPFNSRSGRGQWTTNGAKRLVGQQVDRPPLDRQGPWGRRLA